MKLKRLSLSDMKANPELTTITGEPRIAKTALATAVVDDNGIEITLKDIGWFCYPCTLLMGKLIVTSLPDNPTPKYLKQLGFIDLN